MADVSLNVDGAEISLAELAGLNMDDIEEVRFEVLPKGLSAVFRNKSADIVKMGEKPAISLTYEVMKIFGETEEMNDENMVGKEHQELFFLSGKEPLKVLGMMKAHMSDAGFSASGELQDVLDKYQSHMCKAVIKHTVNKDDEDRPYARMDRLKPFVPEDAGETATEAA